jgi:hypothetical protein
MTLVAGTDGIPAESLVAFDDGWSVDDLREATRHSLLRIDALAVEGRHDAQAQ